MLRSHHIFFYMKILSYIFLQVVTESDQLKDEKDRKQLKPERDINMDETFKIGKEICINWSKNKMVHISDPKVNQKQLVKKINNTKTERQKTKRQPIVIDTLHKIKLHRKLEVILKGSYWSTIGTFCFAHVIYYMKCVISSTR